jgi:predicted RNA-binding protein YlxR (DUF448 family)
MPGRGAHLHPDPGCLALAVRRKAIPRALRHVGELDCTALQTYVDTHGTNPSIEGG